MKTLALILMSYFSFAQSIKWDSIAKIAALHIDHPTNEDKLYELVDKLEKDVYSLEKRLNEQKEKIQVLEWQFKHYKDSEKIALIYRKYKGYRNMKSILIK